MSSSDELLYSTPGMRAAFEPAEHIRQILRFETALAHAQVRAGLIPAAAAAAIEVGCRNVEPDITALYYQAAQAGTIVIPLIQYLSNHIPEAGRDYLHWGATSQDAIDTAFMLQAKQGLLLLETDLLRIGSACAGFAQQHRHTLMMGRTLLQHALPITFGLKAARWLALATRQIAAIRAQHTQLALQFGGAAGTLAALGDRGMAIAAFLAEDLGLVLPDLPWHAERDRVSTLAATVAISAGSVANIAQDIVLLAQNEVGELSEALVPGKGGSSAMPHKQNPVDATFALAAAHLATSQVSGLLSNFTHEYERAAGAWQSEWIAMPRLFCYASGAISRVALALEGLQVHTERMQENATMQSSLSMAEALALALTPQYGRMLAQQIVHKLANYAQREQQSLLQAAQQDAQICAILTPTELATLLSRADYLGCNELLIDRALVAWQSCNPG